MESSTGILSHSKREGFFFFLWRIIPSLKQMVLPITIKNCQYPFKSFSKFALCNSSRIPCDSPDSVVFVINSRGIFFVKRLQQAAVLIASQRASWFFFFLFKSSFHLILERTRTTNVAATRQRLRGAVSHYSSSPMNKIVDEYFRGIPNCSHPLGWRWNVEKKNSATLTIYSLACFHW